MRTIRQEYEHLLNRPCTTWTLDELEWMRKCATATRHDLTRSGHARAMASVALLIVNTEMERRAELIDRDWLAHELNLADKGVTLAP